MSRLEMQRLFGKMLVDESFRKAVSANPTEVLKHFDLTAKERTTLGHLDHETVDKLGSQLTSRLGVHAWTVCW